MKLSKVTRFELVDNTTEGQQDTAKARRDATGAFRVTRYGVSLQLSLQDEGCTLKVFLSDSETTTADEVQKEIIHGLGEWVLRDNTDDCGVCTKYADGTVMIRKECPEHGLT